MARTKQTARHENRRKALSRPPPESQGSNNDMANNDSRANDFQTMDQHSSTADENPKIAVEATKEDSIESSLSSALTQPDQEEADKDTAGNTSAKRKTSEAEAEPGKPEEPSQVSTLADHKKRKISDQIEEKRMEPTSKSNVIEGDATLSVSQPTQPKKTARTQQSRQSEPTSVQPGPSQHPAVAVHQSTNLPPGGRGVMVPSASEGFGLTDEDKRLLWAYREVNRDFWVRVAHGIRQLGGGQHTPEKCKERFEILSRL